MGNIDKINASIEAILRWIICKSKTVFSPLNSWIDSIDDKTARIYGSIGRFLFYMIVVYGAVLAGASVFLKTSIYDWHYWVVTGLFLPFIFVYSMLFELGDDKIYPERINGIEALKRYFKKEMRWIGVFGVVIAILFSGCVIFLSATMYLPLWFYLFIFPLEFVSVSFLFASKYHKLELDRQVKHELKKKRDPSIIDYKVRSIIAVKAYWWLTLIFLFALYTAVIIYRDNKEYIYFGTVSALLVFMLFLIIWFSWIWNNANDKKPDDKFFYEKATVRELLLQLSICVIPFMFGVVLSLNSFTSASYWGLSFMVLASSKVLSILLLIIVFGVILENMRYIATYDESYFYRTIRDDCLIVDKYKTSLNNFVLLIAIIFSAVPLLLVYSDFKAEFIVVFVFFIYIMLFAAVNILKPFDEMGFARSRRFDGVNKKGIKKLFTPRNNLILIKIISFMILLFGVRYGYLNFQDNNVYYDTVSKNFCIDGHRPSFINSVLSKLSLQKKENVCNEIPESKLLISEKLYPEFIKARYSCDYQKKTIFIQLMRKSDGEDAFVRQKENIFKALRMDPLQVSIYDDQVNKSGFFENHSLIKYIRDNDYQNFANSSGYFVVSCFLTILVGLVLSSVFVDVGRFNVAKKISYGVFVQGVFVLILTYLFIGQEIYLPKILSYSGVIPNHLLFLMYSEKYISTVYVYVALAFLLLTLVVFQRYLKDDGEVANINVISIDEKITNI
jgi:hypothetical protein